MSQPEQDRRIDYIEFATRDIAATKKFYAASFAWAFKDYGPDYTSFSDRRLSGGFARNASAPTKMNPLVVIYAMDLEKTQARIIAAGGKITAKTHDFPGGRRFSFADPAGLELAVWSDLRDDGTAIK